jgi:hypothetical protein
MDNGKPRRSSQRQNVEGVKLHFLVALARGKALKSAMPSTPRMTASPSMTNCVCRFFQGAVDDPGKAAQGGAMPPGACPLGGMNQIAGLRGI